MEVSSTRLCGSVKSGLFLITFFLAACASESKKDLVVNDNAKEKMLITGSVSERDMESLVALSIVCVDQEYPNYYDAWKIPGRPRLVTPSFYGCCDWHSAVHAHWAMLRFLRLFPNSPLKERILDKLNPHFEIRALAIELKNLSRLKKIEEPYGLSWFLALQDELNRSALPEVKKWTMNMHGLTNAIRHNLLQYFRGLKEAKREGTHHNTAFSMAMDIDYAKLVHDHELLKLLETKAREFYGQDKSCPLGSEPAAGDFLSPCFAEADVMRRILPAEEFRNWFASFLPSITADSLQPVVPLNWKDPLTTHFVGLMFHKAWTMRAIAAELIPEDARKTILLSAAEANEITGQRLIFDSGYPGTHWLATFAIYNFSPLFLK